MRIFVLAGLALWLIAAAPPPSKRLTGLQFVDLTSEFDDAWTQTKDLPDDQRVTQFEAAFAKALPGFYDPKRVEDRTPAAKYQARVLRGLNDYPAQRQEIEQISRQFSAMIAPAQRSFERAFGPMRGYPPIYLVNSFGEFDGGTRDLPEGNRLMFGADVIAKQHKGMPNQPFFHHELFHLLHSRTFKGCDQIWCNVWSEGLAVYVASRLNPDADDAALLLAFPVPLRPAVEGHKAEAICAVSSRLNSSDPKDYGPLFMGGGKGLSDNLPPRFAYYVGYLVARDLGRTRSLKQLAALPNDEVRPLVQQSVAQMASCPPSGT